MAGGTEIAIRLRTNSQLFNLFDPSPFRERDIDSGVKEFVVGWVANWRPTEICLYDSLPIRCRIRLYHRIATAKVEMTAF